MAEKICRSPTVLLEGAKHFLKAWGWSNGGGYEEVPAAENNLAMKAGKGSKEA